MTTLEIFRNTYQIYVDAGGGHAGWMAVLAAKAAAGVDDASFLNALYGDLTSDPILNQEHHTLSAQMASESYVLTIGPHLAAAFGGQATTIDLRQAAAPPPAPPPVSAPPAAGDYADTHTTAQLYVDIYNVFVNAGGGPAGWQAVLAAKARYNISDAVFQNALYGTLTSSAALENDRQILSHQMAAGAYVLTIGAALAAQFGGQATTVDLRQAVASPPLLPPLRPAAPPSAPAAGTVGVPPAPLLIYPTPWVTTSTDAQGRPTGKERMTGPGQMVHMDIDYSVDAAGIPSSPARPVNLPPPSGSAESIVALSQAIYEVAGRGAAGLKAVQDYAAAHGYSWEQVVSAFKTAAGGAYWKSFTAALASAKEAVATNGHQVAGIGGMTIAVVAGIGALALGGALGGRRGARRGRKAPTTRRRR